MSPLTRRDFSAIAFTLAAQAPRLTAASKAATSLDDLLRTGIERRKIPAVAAMVATADKITYQGAFGKRDVASSGARATPDSIFAAHDYGPGDKGEACFHLMSEKYRRANECTWILPEVAPVEVIPGLLIEQTRAALIPNRLLASL